LHPRIKHTTMLIKSFPAGKGDAFALQWKNHNATHYLLVDAGIPATYMHIKSFIKSKGLPLAVIVTHVDYDHVGGFTKLFNDEALASKDSIAVYVNTPDLIFGSKDGDAISVAHGLSFSLLLEKLNIEPSPLYVGLHPHNKLALSGLSLAVLSPPKEVIVKLMQEWTAQPLFQKLMEERRISPQVAAPTPQTTPYADIIEGKEVIHNWQDDLDNAASIAFWAQDEQHSVLMLGDSNPTLVYLALLEAGYCPTNKLRVNLVKLSHHGCRHNSSKDLLSLIDCKCFYISTNGAGNYYHPHRETIVRICEYCRSDRTEHIQFFTNYELDSGQFITTDEMEQWNISFSYKPELDLAECQ
jgi:beta-lactamase superfamily II metal-dependent hydrolase